MSNTTDRINEENRKKRFEEVKKQGEQVESKLNLINEYNETLGVVGKAHMEHNETQKKRILRLAILVDRVNDTPKQKICAQVCKDLDQYGIEADYVRKILPDEYKDKKHAKKPEEIDPRYQHTTTTSHGSKLVTNSAQNNIHSELEQKQQVRIGNNGESILDHDKDNPLDDIHEGKSFEQMKREYEITAAAATRQRVEEELREDKEALENPQNRVPLLSEKSAEYREMEARVIEQEKIIEEQNKRITKKDQDFFNLKRSYIQSRDRVKDEEITKLKVKLNNAESLIADYDKEALAKDEGLKDIEILKIEPLTISLLINVSRKSQRTLFLLVNPKTMQIKRVKTDVDMHQYQARKTVGVL